MGSNWIDELDEDTKREDEEAEGRADKYDKEIDEGSKRYDGEMRQKARKYDEG